MRGLRSLSPLCDPMVTDKNIYLPADPHFFPSNKRDIHTEGRKTRLSKMVGHGRNGSCRLTVPLFSDSSHQHWNFIIRTFPNKCLLSRFPNFLKQPTLPKLPKFQKLVLFKTNPQFPKLVFPKLPKNIERPMVSKIKRPKFQKLTKSGQINVQTNPRTSPNPTTVQKR